MPTVVEIELIQLRLPLAHEFRTSSHAKRSLEHILVKMTDADGAVGWGECASPADPYFNAENVQTCWHILHDYLAPSLLGREWTHPQDAYRFGDRVRGNQFAKAGLDIACWDLWSRRNDSSLAAALGAAQPQIEAGVSLGIEPSVEDLLTQVGTHLEQGYRRIKLKIAPGWDIEPVGAVRAEFGEVALHVDANCAYPDRPETLELLRRLDDYQLLMIEQPFAADDMLAHARAQEQLATPICLDEAITSTALARTALRLDAGRVVNVKVSRLGGLIPAVEVHDLCRAAGIPVWCGGMHEFGVGRAANVALAALPGFTLPSDVSGSDKYYRHDVVEPPIVAERGYVTVPFDRPGIGHEVRLLPTDERITRTAVLGVGTTESIAGLVPAGKD